VTESSDTPATGPTFRTRQAAWLTTLLYRYRTEHNTPGRQALSIGLGLYIGASPFIGFHLLMAMVFGWLFRLNRLKVYLASHISNPLFAPVLYASEIQIGSWLRTGHVYSTATLAEVQLRGLALDVLIGSVVVGLTLSVTGAIVTYALMSGRGRDPHAVRLVNAAAERYLTIGLSTWEFAHSKLEMDDVYLGVLRDGVLPASGVLYDLGCGQGLMLTLIATARDAYRSGDWPKGWPAPPDALELRGIEIRSRVAKRTRGLLQDVAVVEERDLSDVSLAACDVVLLLDVLHLMSFEAQERILAEIARALRPGGLLIIREADAAGGWRFNAVRIGNRLTAWSQGRFGRRFQFNSAEGWTARLEALGFDVITISATRHGPFANFVAYSRKKTH
jgi:uncharacterized protein (DUF2062 family)/SAM-dependent methyltransferase